MPNQEHKTVETNSLMDKSFVRMLVGSSVVGVLFYFAVQTFLNLLDDVTDYKYDMLAERFSISMDYAHRQWQLRGKPDVVTLEYFENNLALKDNKSKQLQLKLNQTGWPISIGNDNNSLDCFNLWMYFAHEESGNIAIKNLTRQLDVKAINGNCHFLHKEKFPNQLMFSYNSNNGQVVSSSNK